jgi:hypothetical protein
MNQMDCMNETIYSLWICWHEWLNQIHGHELDRMLKLHYMGENDNIHDIK